MADIHESGTETILFPNLSIFEESEGEEELTHCHVSTWAKIKIGTLQSRLEIIKARQDRRHSGRDKQLLPRLLVSLTNEVFGFNGWSSRVLDCFCVSDNFNQDAKTYSVEHRAIVSITFQDGTTVEGEGTGISSNCNQRAVCFSRSKKVAVTEGLRNAILKFPSLLEENLQEGKITKKS